MLLLLDGGKGAGKSTVVRGISNALKNTVFLSLDTLRKKYTDEKTTNDNNAIAYKKIAEETNDALKKGNLVILDSGMTQDRIRNLEFIAKRNNSIFKKVHLSAPKEVLWERVVSRHKSRKKNYSANRERFDYVHEVLMNKDFSGFIKIDTNENSQEEVLKKVLDEIPNKFKK